MPEQSEEVDIETPEASKEEDIETISERSEEVVIEAPEASKEEDIETISERSEEVVIEAPEASEEEDTQAVPEQSEEVDIETPEASKEEDIEAVSEPSEGIDTETPETPEVSKEEDTETVSERSEEVVIEAPEASKEEDTEAVSEPSEGIDTETPEASKEVVSETSEALEEKNEISKEIIYSLKEEIRKVLTGMNRNADLKDIEEILVDPAKIENLLNTAYQFARMGENEYNSVNTHELYKNLSKQYNSLTAKQKYSLHKLKKNEKIENTITSEIKNEQKYPPVQKTVENYKELIQKNKESFLKIIENNQRIQNWEESIIKDLSELTIYKDSNILKLEKAVKEEIEDLRYEKIIEFDEITNGYYVYNN